ncbi:MAG: hypothetical protein KAJ10_13700, partial [Thermodesulfovibrionia bacterium]|nr:hypothetical protein [Thermodesulfovibrionia bacterium]
MKKLIFKKPFWQSFLSALVLAVFAYFALATIPGTNQQKTKLPDGRWELSKTYSKGHTETIRGNVDGGGLWEGPVIIVFENADYVRTHTEEVNMKEGLRHGISKVTYPNGVVNYVCYQYGERVEMENCEKSEKSATISAEDNSAYHIFSYKVPWFEFKLDASDYDSNYVKAYLDTLEAVLYSSVFNENDFDDYYDGVIADLEETAYDSIIQLNNEHSLYNGLDLILSHEFRLATHYSYGKSDSNTYNVIKSIYPNYLLDLNASDVTDADFEGFCSEYDSIMSSYDPIALDDPYFVDSLDERMYRTMDYIYSSDAKSANVSKSLKSAVLSNKVRTIHSFQREYLSQIRNQTLNKTPQEVAEIVLYTILEEFIYGDLIKSAVREAYTIKEGIVRLPTVITNFSGNTSSTSVTLNGNVIEDGGGEVTSRGIAWGMIYNPTIDNQILTVGTGTGDFTATLTELTEGETYYARAFATNSAGTAY